MTFFFIPYTIKGLVQLWSNLSQQAPGQIEILAFPCNQFGKQEPGTAREIKEFAAEQGVQFRMMQKINVNGPQADLVYKFLKYTTAENEGDALQNIQWNFATYYVVDPKGDVQVFHGVEPLQLQELALNLLNDEL
jgi:glutathione peroxidase